jgi:molybdate transport system substrate-binding protein
MFTSLASSQASPNLIVAAAADLAPLESSIAAEMRDSLGIRLRFTLGSSGMLARQIENGAPYDVYLSANERFVADLARRGLVLPASVRVYAEGRLGLWSKDGKIRDLNQLKDYRVRHIAIPNPAHAPYGAAAKQALTRMGLWKQLEDRIVYAENVRQAFEFASSGNAEAAITAWTLLHDRGGVLIDASWHDPLRQAGAVVATTKQPEAAQRLLDYLTSAQGKALLTRHGLSCDKIEEPR